VKRFNCQSHVDFRSLGVITSQKHWRNVVRRRSCSIFALFSPRKSHKIKNDYDDTVTDTALRSRKELTNGCSTCSSHWRSPTTGWSFRTCGSTWRRCSRAVMCRDSCRPRRGGSRTSTSRGSACGRGSATRRTSSSAASETTSSLRCYHIYSSSSSSARSHSPGTGTTASPRSERPTFGALDTTLKGPPWDAISVAQGFELITLFYLPPTRLSTNGMEGRTLPPPHGQKPSWWWRRQ